MAEVSLVKTSLRWMLLDFTDVKSTSVQVMAWCPQTTNHYLSRCLPNLCRHLTSLGHNESMHRGWDEMAFIVRKACPWMKISMSWLQFDGKLFPVFPALIQTNHHVDGLVQDCSNFIANALELLQSCTEPSMWSNDVLVYCVIRHRWGHSCDVRAAWNLGLYSPCRFTISMA